MEKSKQYGETGNKSEEVGEYNTRKYVSEILINIGQIKIALRTLKSSKPLASASDPQLLHLVTSESLAGNGYTVPQNVQSSLWEVAAPLSIIFWSC